MEYLSDTTTGILTWTAVLFMTFFFVDFVHAAFIKFLSFFKKDYNDESHDENISINFNQELPPPVAIVRKKKNDFDTPRNRHF